MEYSDFSRVTCGFSSRLTLGGDVGEGVLVSTGSEAP